MIGDGLLCEATRKKKTTLNNMGKYNRKNIINIYL